MHGTQASQAQGWMAFCREKADGQPRRSLAGWLGKISWIHRLWV